MFLLSLNKVPTLLLLCLLLGQQSLFAGSGNLTKLSPEKEINFAETTLSPVLALTAPTNVNVRPSLVGALSISWDVVPGANQYVIEYAKSPTGSFTQLATVNAPLLSYRHTGLSFDQTVYYRVKASDGNTASAFSNTVSGKTFSSGHVFRILPLGDSNTKGSNSTLPEADQNEPYQYAYRKKLYQLLMGASVPFDFIGSERSGTASNEFADYEHGSFGGARVRDIAALLEFGQFDYYNSGVMRGPGGGAYLDKYNPDIILLHIGTNWVFNDQTIIDELNKILEQVDAYEERANKEVTVVLARIIKRCQDCSDRPLDPEKAAEQDEYTRIYNENLWGLAGERIVQGDRLIRVDMENGAGINYFKNQGNDMIDYLHLTEAGYAKMAQVWFNALKADLTVVPPPLDADAPETNIVSKPDALTNSKTATFSFSSNEQDVKYELSWNGGTFTTTTNPVTFNDLADGTYTIAVRATDATGNVDATPATYTWTVDTKAPAAPIILAISEDTGSRNNDKLTSDNTLKISGTAEVGAVVTVSEAALGTLGTTTANSSGVWEFSYEGTSLAEKVHAFSAVAKDAAGNTGPASSNFEVTIDRTAPAGYTIAFNTNRITAGNVNNIGLEVKEAEVNASYFYVIRSENGNKEVTGTKVADAAAFTISGIDISGLEDGSLTATFYVVDAAGNKGNNTTATVIKDTNAPETLIATKPDVLSNKKSATFSFTSNEQDVTYEVSWNGGAFTATTNPVTFNNLADGTYTIAVRATDASGNVDATPATYTWTVDTQAPAAPAITIPAPDAMLQTTPTFAGTAEPTSQVTITLDGRVFGTTTTDAQGKWSFVAASALSEGNHKISGTATDAAGNNSPVSPVVTFTIDATPPPAPIILAITEDTGSRNNDQITNDRKLRFSGSAEAGAMVTLSESTLGTIGTATANSNGAWEVNYEGTTLAEKAYSFRAVARDVAGNTSPASNGFVVHIDITAPVGYAVQFNTNKVDLNNMKNVGFQVSGAEVGATYFYSVSSNNGGTPVTGTAVATATGFSISGLDVSGLQDGELTASFYMVDVAGNQGSAATTKVEKVTKNIMAVKALDSIKVPFKTAFSDVPLPVQVEVTYSDNTKEMLPVTWQQDTYNGERPASYILNGALQLKPNTSNSTNKVATIVVEVEPNKAPTAVDLSALAFQPNIAPSEAIGTFTTVDPDDKVHTYTLVSGAGNTHNNLFEIREDKLYLKSNKGLSGNTDFMIRVRSTDGFENLIEKAFTLKKEPFKGKIKLANAFTPDGDGVNDTWVLPELRFFDNVDIQIFDRSGTRVFQTNDPENGWNGRNLKGNIQEGAYFYILTVKDIELVQKGVVTVIK